MKIFSCDNSACEKTPRIFMHSVFSLMCRLQGYSFTFCPLWFISFFDNFWILNIFASKISEETIIVKSESGAEKLVTLML